MRQPSCQSCENHRFEKARESQSRAFLAAQSS
uniref:Uncharacterized protein n=1 Tax=Anguilla anguilla TaxID=7936 RepID=A0A0E9QSG0_ANGAN